MRIERLEIENFRNIRKTAIEPCRAINIICGENGQGKTSILESAGLFNGMRSFRGAKNREMITDGEDFSVLSLGFFAAGREQEARMTVTAEQREVSCNKIKLPAASAMMGRFCTVIFSPDRMSLISGGAAERRKFLDAAISQLKPRFAALLVEYNRVLFQRNNLLRTLGRDRSLISTVPVWDIRLAALSAKISAEREAFTKKLDGYAAGIYDGISAGREPLRLEYRCSYCKDGEYEKSMLASLSEGLESDIRAGFTQRGAQKDDMEIMIGAKNGRAYGSQGQKRSAVLSVKLAEARLLSDVLGEQPVALLDDVMSELDPARQSYLLNRLDGWQVFMTCCDPAPLKLLDKGRVFEMRNGEASELVR